MDCFCRLSAESPKTCRVAVVVDLLYCLVTHCVVLAAWDDQADAEDPEDLTYSRLVEFEVLDQAWDGPVDQVAGC